MNSVINDILSGRGLKPLPICTYEYDGVDHEYDGIDLNWFFYNNDIVRQVCDKAKSLRRKKKKQNKQINRFFKRKREMIMSGGRFEYADMTAKNMIFDYDKCTNVFEDREISELVWDVFDLIHSFDWYKSGDTDKSNYLKAKRAFKKKWFKNRGVRARRIIDEAIAELKQELYETYDLDIKDVPQKNTRSIMDLVYEELSDDSDNCRANRIIDAADEYAYPKDEGLEPCPFCGDTPITTIALPHFERLMADCIAIKIVCPVCHIAKSVCIREGTDFGTVKEEMDRLIEDWNTRMRKE